MRCIVTGGAGFIGRHLVRYLNGRGHYALPLDLVPNKDCPYGSLVADIVTDDLNRLFRGQDVIFHLAARPSVPRSIAEPELSHRVNIDGTFNVLDAARLAGVRRVVFASSSSVYGFTPSLFRHEFQKTWPASPYAAQKAAGEMYMQAFMNSFGLETVSLRYFNVYGPQQAIGSAYSAVIPNFIEAALEDKAPHIYGDGEQIRDFTYVKDVAEATMLAGTSPQAPGQTMNIGGGSGTSVNSLWKAICDNIGGICPSPVYAGERTGDVRNSCADITLAAQILGWHPSTLLTDGLAETIAAYRLEFNL